MTVRTAEILMAIFLTAASVALMVKSADNNIGWISGSGPGAGAWPFWMAGGMLLCSIWTAIRWLRKTTPESTNEEMFMGRGTVKIIGITLAALILFLAGTHIIGMFITGAIFMFFYVRILGRHSWPVSIALTVAVPVFMFCFFEWALKVPLPKGYSEPLFYPLYGLIY